MLPCLETLLQQELCLACSSHHQNTKTEQSLSHLLIPSQPDTFSRRENWLGVEVFKLYVLSRLNIQKQILHYVLPYNAYIIFIKTACVESPISELSHKDFKDFN